MEENKMIENETALDEILDMEFRCENCGKEIDNDQYPVCDECLVENELTGEEKFNEEQYAKQIEKEFAGKSIPELGI